MFSSIISELLIDLLKINVEYPIIREQSTKYGNLKCILWDNKTNLLKVQTTNTCNQILFIVWQVLPSLTKM